MLKINIWGWDKKKRTMLRYIKSGDIFCFQLNKQKYCFGRIMTKFPEGHVAAILDYISTDTVIKAEDIQNASRLIQLVVLDSYSLFDKKAEGEWRIVGHQEDYKPSNVEDIYFTYGIGAWCKKVDIFGNEPSIKQEEQAQYIRLSPIGDIGVRDMILQRIES